MSDSEMQLGYVYRDGEEGYHRQPTKTDYIALDVCAMEDRTYYVLWDAFEKALEQLGVDINFDGGMHWSVRCYAEHADSWKEV